MRRTSLALIAVLLLFAASASAQNISTFAGGSDIYNNVPTLTNNLPQPQYVVVDSAGNFYISMTSRQRVVKVGTTGLLTFFAGTGTCGTAGDGGPASAAQLCNPTGLAFDPAGNLFFADQSNHRIRKIDMASGIITTVAGSTSGFSGDGGPASAAKLSNPRTVAFDGAGNMFIADQSNLRVRRVDAATNIITTVAGNGNSCNYNFPSSPIPCGDGGPATSASFWNVAGVAVDSSGNLFVLDSTGYRVRKVDALTGIIDAFAGNSTAGFSCSLNASSGPATTINLCSPFSITVDATNNLFIADTSFSRIRKVDPSGNLTTVNFFSTSPNGISFDSAGQLFVAYSGGNRIWKVNVTTGAGTIVAGDGLFSFGGDGGPATSARMNTLEGVAQDASGNTYISDTSNSRIRRVDSSGTITSVKSIATVRVAVDNGGNILSATNCQILRLNPITFVSTVVAGNGSCGYAGDGGAATSARLNSPQDVTVDTLGNIFIADTNNHRIRKVDATTGIITTVAGNGATFQPCPNCSIVGTYSGDGGDATLAGLNFPYGVAVDAGGNLVIADTNNQRVRRVDATTGSINTIAGTGTCTSGTDGILATSSGICNPRGIVLDSSGNVLFADTSLNRVRRVDVLSSIISTVAGNGGSGSAGDGGPATSASVCSPWALSMTAGGTLSIAQACSETSARIRQVFVGTGSPTISLSTTSITFADQNVNTTSAPLTLTITNNGTAWLWTSNIVSNNTEFTRTNNCPASIGPGDSCTVSITFRPTTYGARTGTLTINDNAMGGPHLVSLSGNGLAAADGVSPTSLAFGNQAYNVTSTAQSVTVTNIGNNPLNVSSISLTTYWSQTNTCVGFSVAPGGTCTINVTFRPQFVGAVNGVLNISSNALNGTLQVTLSGTGVDPSISYSPSSLSFPDQLMNTTSAGMTVTATNTGTVVFSILSVPISSNYSQTNDCGGTIAVGASCTITVKFTPTTSSTYSGIVYLFASRYNTSTPTVSLTGRGIATPTLFLGNFTITYPNNLVFNAQAYAYPNYANGGPAGTVTLTVDGTTQYTQTIAFNASNYTYFQNYLFTVPGLTAGSHTLSATYTPDPASFYASASATGSVTVNKGSQTITFPSIPAHNYGDPPFALGATASSGLAVSYSVLSGPATVSGNVLTITGVGTVTVRASQAGDSNWNAAGTVNQAFVVSKGNQTITFDPLAGKTYGDPPFALSASASSGLAVSLSVLSGPATILGNTLTITGAGTVTVRASQAGSTLWNAAPNVDQPFTVAKADQTISFATIPDHTYGDAAFALSATATSGLGVSYLASGNCSLTGNSVTITGAGACSVTASQAGNANYNAATDVTQSFNISKFTPTVNVTGGTFMYDASAHPATGSVIGAGGATLGTPSFTYNGSASTPMSAGTYAVVGSFAGDANHNAASNSSASIVINKADQRITYGAPLGDKTYGDAPFTVNASATSGLAVSFSASGNCSVSGNTVTITGAGSCTITTSQPGDSNWNAAADAAQTFNIAKAASTISLSNLSYTFDGTAKSATATTSPLGLTTVNVTYDGSPTPPSAAGNYAVVATLSNANYDAPNATGTLVIGKANQTISFAALAGKTYGDAPFAVSASSSSGLAVSFSIVSGPATITGGTVSITGVGTVVVRASQGGNSNYNAATDVDQSFTVGQAATSTALVSSVNPSLPGQSVTFTATVSSGAGSPSGSVQFFDGATSLGSVPLTGASAALSTSTLAAATTHNITAVFSGDANFQSSTSAAVSQTVIDNVPPDVTVPANMTVEATSAAGAAVTFSATANDNLDGPLTPTCTPASGGTFALGTTTVTCSATDAAGNKGSAHFSVTVRDTTAPVIAAHAGVTVNATSATGATVSYTAPATSDAVDGAGMATCLPASGSTFALGNTTVTCNATDAAGNPATPTSFIVTVRDATPPTITCASPDGLWHASDVSIACTASDSGSGLLNAADASFTLSTGVAGGTENANAATGTRSVCDNAGNCASAGPIGGNKVDKKGPAITINAPANNAVYLLNQAATASFSCADTGSGPGTCAGTVSNGGALNTSSVGTKSFTVTATDAVGNSSSLTYTYSVIYASSGICNGDLGHAILQPINVDGSSVWKQGSTVPAKFRVCDAAGNSVGTAGVVTNFTLYQIQAGTLTTVDETPASTTPDTQFRWDSSARQWIFNFSTKQSPVNVANRTYYFRIDLNDGSSILFQFGLK